MNKKLWSTYAAIMLTVAPLFSDGFEPIQNTNANSNNINNTNTKFDTTKYVPQHIFQLPSEYYEGQTIVPSMVLDKLVLDILPHKGTLSGLLLRMDTKTTLESKYGNYTGEYRLNSNKLYAVAEIDGQNYGLDEIIVGDKNYLRFILDEEELFNQLGNGKHALALIEYSKYGLIRGSQPSKNGKTGVGENENAVGDRHYINVEFDNGKLINVSYLN